MSVSSSERRAELAPRLLRSPSKTQPAQQITSAGSVQRTSAASARWMSKQRATAIEHFASLSRRATRAGSAADDDSAGRGGWASQDNADSPVADVSPQSPEPTVSIFAKKMQDMLPTFSSFSSSISSGSPRTSPSTPPSEPNRVPSPVQDTTSSTPPNHENGPSEHSWQSLWSTLDRFRPPYSKKPEPASTPEPPRDEILDCVDDNNSIMMYGPLEPDETSEVEIACSEIVSINGDGEEIRTPQQSFIPLPSESFDEVVVGSPGRSPLSRFLPLPFESIDQVLTSGGVSPQPHFSPLPLDSINRMLSSGGRSPQPRFLRLPPESIDQVLTGDLSTAEREGSESGLVSETAEAAHTPSTSEPARDKPPVKEYRVWLPSLTKISVQTMWWGFRIYLPPPVLDVLNNKQLEAVKRAAIITTALQWLMDNLPVALLPPQVRPGVTVLRHLVPYVGYMGGFIAWSWSAIRSFDKGYGVVLTASWLLPFVLIPGTWEADQMPTQSTPPASP